MLQNCFVNNPWKSTENLEPVRHACRHFTEKACENRVNYIRPIFSFSFHLHLSGKDYYVSKKRWILQYGTDDFFSVQGADHSLLVSCFTLVELILIFRALDKRATREKRKIYIFFFSPPCEICHKILILKLTTYLMSTKINLTDSQQCEGI